MLGEDPRSAPATRRGSQLGFLPETIAFDAAMTGREVLAFYARLKRLAPSKGEPLLERVGLAAARRPSRRHLLQGHAAAARPGPGAAGPAAAAVAG